MAAKQEPAVGGETPSISDGVAGLELPSGDYALAMLVWSQQTAKAVQVLATDTRAKRKSRHEVCFSFWLRMLGNEFKTIDYRFERNFLNKVGRVSSNLLEVVQIIDHTTTRGSPKRSMSLGGSLVVAPIGGTQPLGLVLALLVQQKKTPIRCLFLLAPNAGLEPATT